MTSSYQKISGFDRPHVSEMLSDSKISTLESGFKNFRICLRIRRMRVDDRRIRKEKVADSKISGYVWTGPKSTFEKVAVTVSKSNIIVTSPLISFSSNSTVTSRQLILTFRFCELSPPKSNSRYKSSLMQFYTLSCLANHWVIPRRDKQ